ncbi:hemolysin family protein [Acidipila sp. EB88]|uniref:hemolysin family protein n=1 Tax=Acidipila sp. EB88 TaxID=2305226 RepID=UPI000F5F47C3|nr:hemolysin family protein [Acidipila sp. EB88]RRA47775.1 HlyC/CorC family transporter [Acidipila sp. EB88]
MSLLQALLLLLLVAILTLTAYIDRMYSEMGKFLSRDFQDNIDIWEEQIEPRLGLGREQVALSAAVLPQLALAAITLTLGILLFDRGGVPARPTPSEIVQTLFAIVLVVILFNRLLPYLFFTRTRGTWLLRWLWPLRILFTLFLPLTVVISFLLSIVTLAAEPSTEKEEEASGAAVDALLEAGQEEGILEEEDHDLIRSAVEFGDKVVREVMTPRPRIFAVPETITIEELLTLLKENPFSRIPVFRGTLDAVTGIVFSHDVLQITDVDAHTQTVSSIARPATFIPEIKRANEALRDMQREKQHMRIVIDEYGGVAGLVTIEDLLEEIVGTITDEHEGEDLEAIRTEREGVWSIPGDFEVAALEDLLDGDWEAPEDYEATTVAGLVSEAAGRIPMPGEVVEENGLRFEILASTDRRIERMRVSRAGAMA